MKQFIFPVALSMALILASCSSLPLDSRYTFDMRAVQVPVMLTDIEATGRAYEAKSGADIENSSSSATYGNVTITTTTTTTQYQNQPASMQLAAVIGAQDRYAKITGINWDNFAMMAPYYGHYARWLRINAIVVELE